MPNDTVLLLRSAGPGKVFALVKDHGLYRSTDGGETWTAGGGLPQKLRDVAVDRSAPSRVFVAAEEGLWRSLDSGVSWTKVGGGLDEEDVEAVVVATTGAVFAASFNGVFQSSDGSTWRNASAGLPNTDVRALAIGGSPPRLYAGTAGGSVWSIELP